MKRIRSFFCLFLFLLLCTAASPSYADITSSDWWPQLQRIDEYLLNGRWKTGDRLTRKLAETVKRKGWHDPELRGVMADLAFFRAVTAANLDEDDTAVAYWHIALNLDARRARERDLGAYGEAARLLLEFPLRRKGEAPPGIRVVKPPFRGGFERAKIPDPDAVILENTGAWQERSADFHAEVVLDEEGRLLQPLVESGTHPVLVYATLELFLFKVRAEPARMNGEPIAVLEHITMPYRRMGR